MDLVDQVSINVHYGQVARMPQAVNLAYLGPNFNVIMVLASHQVGNVTEAKTASIIARNRIVFVELKNFHVQVEDASRYGQDVMDLYIVLMGVMKLIVNNQIQLAPQAKPAQQDLTIKLQ